MDIFVAGGDRRSAFLVRLLRERGLDARAAGLERSGLAQVPSAPLKAAADAETVVLNSPLKCDLAETPFGIGDLLGHLHSGARLVFCGPQIPPAGLERFDARDLTKDEDFLQRNAELTAEGAIYSAMRATERAIMDCDCLIVGWGRIGRALTERLVALGARATVASRTDRGMRLAQAVETAKIADALPGRHIVFSTPPYPVLGKDELSRADAGTLFIDLASPPYGIDLEAARSLDLRAWREPGLPGRYFPDSAAMVLMSHILALRKGVISRD